MKIIHLQMPVKSAAFVSSLLFIFLVTGCGKSNRVTKRQQQLTGNWTYLVFESGNNSIQVQNDTIRIQLKFNGDSMLSGHTGCNEFWGNYSLKGKNLAIYNIAMTRKMCEGITWEHDLISALKNSSYWEIKRKSLKLETKDKKHLYWSKTIDNQ